jgi:hypothetical protein
MRSSALASSLFPCKVGSFVGARLVSTFATLMDSNPPPGQKPLALTTSLPARVVRTCQT